MKNKYHFVITFNDLKDEKQMEIRDALEGGFEFTDLPVEEQVDDVDFVQDRISCLVDEACQAAWCEMEVIISGPGKEDKDTR